MTKEQIHKLAYQVRELATLSNEITDNEVKKDLANTLNWLTWALMDATKKEEE